ncbi:MAG: hypothetical protein AB2660_16710, partial [Candidatus Thiodiazotropha sp.]
VRLTLGAILNMRIHPINLFFLNSLFTIPPILGFFPDFISQSSFKFGNSYAKQAIPSLFFYHALGQIRHQFTLSKGKQHGN